MKLTDIAIVFELLLICLLIVLHVRTALVHNVATTNIMYNNVMDGIVEDALRTGLCKVDKDGKPIVDLKEVVRCYQAEKKLYRDKEHHILIYVEEEGFYIWDSYIPDKWSDMVTFSEGMSTSHANMVKELALYMEENYSIRLSIPFNDGESFANTVEKYSLLSFSIDVSSGIRCFSGARIHKK